jgi:hypothetical protein
MGRDKSRQVSARDGTDEGSKKEECGKEVVMKKRASRKEDG